MKSLSTNMGDRFADELGVALTECSFDQAICKMTAEQTHSNALGGIHGGVIFSLADMAFAAACNAGEGTYIGLQAEIRYMSTPKDKELTATAKRVGGSKKFAHYQVQVTDSQGNHIALLTSTAYKLSQ